METMTQLVKLMVDKPEDVSVEAVSQPNGILLKLSVSSFDVGKIVGKEGRTARSLRVILSAMSKTAKQNITLDIAAD
jgi:uncharacterized protein